MLLPIHPHPQRDEIFTSWLLRLTSGNGYYNHTFQRRLLNYHGGIWNRDIDVLCPDPLIEELSRVSGISPASIRGTTLKSYVGYIYDHIGVNTTTQWLLPLGIFHRKWRWPGMQFCPQCLDCDLPYYRKSWRLSFMTVCPIHHCLLHDRCPKCQQPICYLRAGIGEKSMYLPSGNLAFCTTCMYDLTKATLLPIDENNELNKIYIGFLNDVRSQRLKIGSVDIPVGISFFIGLKRMISAVQKPRNFNLRKKLATNLNLDLDVEQRKAEKQTIFERLPVEKRFLVMKAILYLIERWPENLVSIAKGTDFSISSFSDFRNELPFWLETELKHHFFSFQYTPSLIESISICEHLKSLNLDVTIRNVEQLAGAGRDLSRRIIADYRKNFPSY